MLEKEGTCIVFTLKHIYVWYGTAIILSQTMKLQGELLHANLTVTSRGPVGKYIRLLIHK